MTTIVAIDPGASGGIAWASPSTKAVAVPMPETEGDLIERLKTLSREARTEGNAIVFYLEDMVKHFSGKAIPASAMAVYASNWGFIKGAIQYSAWPLHLVAANTWAQKLGLGTKRGMEKTAWKNKLKSEAQRIYPHLQVTLKTADALLILQWALKDQVRLGIEQREFQSISKLVPL